MCIEILKLIFGSIYFTTIMWSMFSYVIFEIIKLMFVLIINKIISKKNIKIIDDSDILLKIKANYGVDMNINTLTIVKLSSSGLDLRYTINMNYCDNHYIAIIPFNELISGFKLNLLRISLNKSKNINLRVNQTFKESIYNTPPIKLPIKDNITKYTKKQKLELNKILKQKDKKINQLELQIVDLEKTFSTLKKEQIKLNDLLNQKVN